MVFHWLIKNKRWIIKAVCRTTQRTVAWVIGGRDADTVSRLYAKVKHLSECKFYTDHWEAFSKVVPSERYKVGKAETATIERDNRNMRHHLGRFTRRTKIVSKRVEMVDNAIKLWCALTVPEVFARYQKLALSIFT